MFWPHGMMLIIADADYVQDLFQKYNSVFTKGDYTKNLIGDMLNKSLIWTKSEDKTYKPRRKVVSHAFYGSKLQAMSDTIFEVIHERLLKWPTLYSSGEIDLVNELV
jgi:cytochrome P450